MEAEARSIRTLYRESDVSMQSKLSIQYPSLPDSALRAHRDASVFLNHCVVDFFTHPRCQVNVPVRNYVPVRYYAPVWKKQLNHALFLNFFGAPIARSQITVR